ncbi:checkpoint protein Rad24 [Dendrothele bispora CBS 962.96]|uniref:Checkpoint protein Rad24 n=1 Tax=Dendrothele bispora (strain CBS 962.96) TaxID=1314807 RepID=A0A4S8M8V2_DENBC|nr:checkpoint protein Rad24 [Dendrothele bispora CBS 962.96]
MGRKSQMLQVIDDHTLPGMSTEYSTSDGLWIDLYEPETEAELAVHVRKVSDVRQWLQEAFSGGPSGKLRRYRRILVLTGPAGTAKTTTIRVLSREMNFEIMEWRNASDDVPARSHVSRLNDSYAISSSSDPWPYDRDEDSESSFMKFQAFLARATRCNNIFSSVLDDSNDRRTSSSSTSSLNSTNPKRIILLEDLPNILHLQTRTSFHGAIEALLDSSTYVPDPVPIVMVISDSGTRGEAEDERIMNGGWSGGRFGKDRDGVMDVRTVLRKEILNGPFVTQIRFNPIAPTLLKKALSALLTRHFSTSTSGSGSTRSPVSSTYLDLIVDSANGDIRSAIMSLQFACTRLGVNSKKKGRKGNNDSKTDEQQVLVESITRREQSLVLFHLMGKVLYNKRKGDPPASSALARDIKREQELDKRLKDPPKLPEHLKEHDRKASRVDVDVLYSDSPIDSSLFSLYIHQNYTQFCDEMSHCEGVSEWLSWADSSGGEAWYQTNPHQFHLLSLGTLHSLPEPVTRRGQRVYKPEFFDALEKEKNAWEGVRDTREWIVKEGVRTIQSATTDVDGMRENAVIQDLGWNISGWTHRNIAMELGGVLKAREKARIMNASNTPSNATALSGFLAPRTHHLFSAMEFIYPSRSGAGPGASTLDETEDGREPQWGSDGAVTVEEQQEMGMWQDSQGLWGVDLEKKGADGNGKGWLEEDDIEDW